MADQEKLVLKMQLCEQAERYTQMIKYSKELVLTGKVLNAEERNLLSVAFKNEIGQRRASWRILSHAETKNTDNENRVTIIKEERLVLEQEMKDLIFDVLELLDNHLIKTADASTDMIDAKIFYNKMAGDYYRYLAEIELNDKREEYASKSEQAYNTATDSSTDLGSVHPLKLGLALNFSTFYYEIRNDGTKACELAKKAFDEAIVELDSLKDESYRDSTLIMQMLRDNLTLWSSEEM